MAPSKKRQPGRSKNKGNRYERQEAKKLSTWMFNEPNILYRHEDSGARKVVYTGDIIPKDVENFEWDFWPFVVELKNGYKDHVPTLMKQTMVRKWMVKLLSERTITQKLPLLICQFHYQIPILLTTLLLDAYCDISLIQEYNGTYEVFYVYKYKDLLNVNFFDVMPSWFKSTIYKDPENNLASKINVENRSNKHSQGKELCAPKSKVAQKHIIRKSKNEQIGEIIGQLSAF